MIFKQVRNYEQSFDLIIIDAGAGDSNIVRSAIAAATYGLLIIPCQPSPYDILVQQIRLTCLQIAEQRLTLMQYFL